MYLVEKLDKNCFKLYFFVGDQMGSYFPFAIVFLFFFVTSTIMAFYIFMRFPAKLKKKTKSKSFLVYIRYLADFFILYLTDSNLKEEEQKRSRKG